MVPWTWLKIRTNKKKIVLGNVTQLLGASEQGDHARVKDLVDQGVDPNSRDEAGFTVLMEAAMHGREEVAANLLGRSDINPEARDEDGNGGGCQVFAHWQNGVQGVYVEFDFGPPKASRIDG